MIEWIGCIGLIIIMIFSVVMFIDELRTNYVMRKNERERNND